MEKTSIFVFCILHFLDYIVPPTTATATTRTTTRTTVKSVFVSESTAVSITHVDGSNMAKSSAEQGSRHHFYLIRRFVLSSFSLSMPRSRYAIHEAAA